MPHIKTILRASFLPFIFLLVLGQLLITPAGADENSITVASTTSTANSGLFDSILPKFTEKTGVQVNVVAVGTGHAIKLAQNGDADILFVHHQPSEEKFVKEGYGIKRYDVMYNDFVLIGPKANPANIGENINVVQAIAEIAASQSVFISRGDDSGTHKKERGLWELATIDPSLASGSWYRETGSGMGATLNIASAMNGYTITDRGTWISFKNKGDLTILNQGDKMLFNPYGVILVNPKRFPHIKAGPGQAFIDWLISAEGQTAIAEYQRDGQQLFFPNAR